MVLQITLQSLKRTLNQIKSFYLSFRKYELPPKKDSKDETDRSEKILEEIIPKDRKKTYEMREIIKMVVDDKDFFEMSNFLEEDNHRFARLDGFSVGIFANDSNFYAGSMTADNAKITVSLNAAISLIFQF